jgi:hypothetical protein
MTSERISSMDGNNERINAMVEELGQEAELEQPTLPETKPVETQQEVKAEEKPAEDTPQTDVSYLSETDEEQDEVQEQPANRGVVPISALQKERQKRQELQRQIAELKRQPEPEPEVELDISELEGDPDEFVDKKTVAGIVQKSVKAAVKSTLSQMEKQRATEAQAFEANQRKNAIAKSEQDARKKFADYDAIVKTAIQEGVFLQEEVDSIKRSANPGVVLYRKSKEALTMLGIEMASNVKHQTKTDNPPVVPEDDEDIYASVFGKRTG